MNDTCALHGRTNFSESRSRDINNAMHGAKPLNDSKNATTLASNSCIQGGRLLSRLLVLSTSTYYCSLQTSVCSFMLTSIDLLLL